MPKSTVPMSHGDSHEPSGWQPQYARSVAGVCRHRRRGRPSKRECRSSSCPNCGDTSLLRVISDRSRPRTHCREARRCTHEADVFNSCAYNLAQAHRCAERRTASPSPFADLQLAVLESYLRHFVRIARIFPRQPCHFRSICCGLHRLWHPGIAVRAATGRSSLDRVELPWTGRRFPQRRRSHGRRERPHASHLMGHGQLLGRSLQHLR